MAKTITSKELIAFKIGARARKFAVEGFAIEGYEYLYTALAESKTSDNELNALLQNELLKLEKCVSNIQNEEEGIEPVD